MISSRLEQFRDFNFTYQQQFRYRWTENFLHSALIDLAPGANTITIGGQQVVVDLPQEDSGIRGIIWSDPCFSSKWIWCAYARRFQTFNRSISMLNAAFQEASMNFFAILGDNFYDRTGELTKTFFARLSPDVKRRFMLVVNGNHDNWVCGSPACGAAADNFGIGQMQYYPSDAKSSTLEPQSDESFIDFSIDPDAKRQWHSFQNKGTNFLVYHKLGNIGFLGFSGGASFEDMRLHFQEACHYFEESKPAVVFLVGHWNTEGDGCQSHMAVPEVRSELLSMPGCTTLGQRLKYLDGHKHCNYVQAHSSEPYGFMIGAHGMADACLPQFGFVFLDSTGGRVKLHYFEVHSLGKGDRYQKILNCAKSRGGLATCTDLAETWLDIPAESVQATGRDQFVV